MDLGSERLYEKMQSNIEEKFANKEYPITDEDYFEMIISSIY